VTQVIVFGLAVLACLTVLLRHWISESSRKGTAASRHVTWRTISSELPAGSQLTGTEPDSQTIVRIGDARERERTGTTRATLEFITVEVQGWCRGATAFGNRRRG
jgi:hypothetical protein